MDLSRVIERHRKPLLRIVATLFAMAGLAEAEPAGKIPKPVYLAVLRLLRPAESAVRRLIVTLSHGLAVKKPAPRAAPANPGAPRPRQCRAPRPPAFQLFDPLQRFSTTYRIRRHPMPSDFNRPQPRIRILGDGFDPRIPMFRNAAPAPPPPPPEPEPDDAIPAHRLSRRLIALKSALDDLPRQALRYARWRSRPSATRRPQRTSALRPGRPPGQRRNPLHKVDRILSDCDWLARHPPQADTS